jgi:hypothetical protein
VSTFLTELGRRFAERWVSLLVLPGLLYAGALAAAAVLGGWRLTWIGTAADRIAAALADAGVARPATGGAVSAVLLIGVSLLATGAGLAAQALGGPVERINVGLWPRWAGPLARPLIHWRHRRWTTAHDRYTSAAAGAGAGAVGRRPSRAELAAARNRIALQPPARPTWIGDRLRAADSRIWDEYGLDLSFCWSRLWLVIPDASRQAVRDSRDRFAAANLVGAWAVLYAGLGALWWPMLVVAALVGLAGWRRSRAAAEALADLVEAVVDIHAPDLANALGVPIQDNRVGTHVGRQITERFRKGG